MYKNKTVIDKVCNGFARRGIGGNNSPQGKNVLIQHRNQRSDCRGIEKQGEQFF